MSTDPYYSIQKEIQSSLQTATTLRASYLRIRSTARGESEELAWARNELKATLSALEADLEDLEESVKIVESTGPRMFGLEESNVIERRKYVSRVRQELEGMRAEVEGTAPPSSSTKSLPISRSTSGTSTRPSGYFDNDKVTNGDGDAQIQWAQQEQQLIIQEQDRTMDSISGTLMTLAQQAGLMGQEIGEHNEMLEDLEANVDRTDSKLSSAMRRMRKFVRDTEETKSGWCIAILVVILVVLLIVVILI